MSANKIRGMLTTLMNHDSGPYYVKVKTESLDKDKIQTLVDQGIRVSLIEGKTMFTTNLTKEQVRFVAGLDWVITLQA